MRYAGENDYDAAIAAASAAYVVPVALIKAIIGTESSFVNGRASSSSFGLMQLYPPTAQTFVPGVTAAQLQNDAGLNIDIGTRYLRRLLNQFPDSLASVASAYNAGPGNAVVATSPYDFCTEWKGGTKPANAVVARDCVPSAIRHVQVGEYPNQPYVDKVLDNYNYFLGQSSDDEPAPYTGPAYGPDDPNGWRPGEMSGGDMSAPLVIGVVLLGAAAVYLLGRK